MVLCFEVGVSPTLIFLTSTRGVGRLVVGVDKVVPIVVVMFICVVIAFLVVVDCVVVVSKSVTHCAVVVAW